MAVDADGGIRASPSDVRIGGLIACVVRMGRVSVGA